MNAGMESKMAPRSDHSQSPVRSAQGEAVSNREFQLYNLRRITSAREPLAIEQDHRKVSPMRRKLRKNHHLFNSERLGVTVPRQMMRDLVCLEEKQPSPPPADLSSSRQSKISSLEHDMYDLGPTEILYSSPFEMSSSVYSSQSTTIPSCTSVRSSLASSAVTRFTSSTLKHTFESEDATATATPSATLQLPPHAPSAQAPPAALSLISNPPSVALQKCLAEGFENLDEILKLSPREQALLPRSVYLAAQLAATPNVNYSAKYGFRPLVSTKWESPRIISAKFLSNPDAPRAQELPSYFKEASHPLSDLKFIARPWWLSVLKVGDRKGKRKQRQTIKRGLLADSVEGLFESVSTFLTTTLKEDNINVQQEYEPNNIIYDTEENVRTPSKNQIYSLLLQKINEKRRKTLNGQSRMGSRRTVVEVNSRATQTYITHPSYIHNHVEFWNEHADNNEPTIGLKEEGKDKPSKSVASVATSCSLHSPQFGIRCVRNPEIGILQTNPTPFTLQNIIAQPNAKLPAFGYFNPPAGCNVNPPFPYLPMPPMKLTPNQNTTVNVSPIPIQMMHGTGDNGNKIVPNNINFPNIFIPVTYVGNPMPKMVPSICEIRPFTNNQLVYINQPGIPHTPCLVQPLGVPLS